MQVLKLTLILHDDVTLFTTYSQFYNTLHSTVVCCQQIIVNNRRVA